MANSVAAPIFFSTTKTHVMPNGTIGATAADQWSQNWTLTPLEDPDQLRRLRALYRFGAGLIGRNGLACEYTLVQKGPGGGSSSTTQTVNVYVNGTKTSSEKAQPSDDKEIKYSLPECGDRHVDQPDPAFLKPPGCILCDYSDPKDLNHKLVVNHLLTNAWLWNPSVPLPPDAVRLGQYAQQELYLVPSESRLCSLERLNPLECSQLEFSDFILLVLDATLQTSSTSATKGSPQKGGAPALLQEPARPQFQLE